MMGMERAAPVGNRWLTERRDFFVRLLVDDFFSLHRSFVQLQALVRENKELLGAA